MIVEIDKRFFEVEPTDRPRLAIEICQILEHDHYIAIKTDLIDRFEKFIKENTAQTFYELFKSAFTEKINPCGQIARRLQKVNFYDFTRKERETLLMKPSELLLENAPYEWNIYRSMIEAYKNDAVISHLKRVVEHNMLVPENAGGYTTMPSMIELKDNGEYKNLYKRKVCLLFDRDTDSCNNFDNQKDKLFKVLTGKKADELTNNDVYRLDFDEGYVWHMWYKREIENYFPKDSYRNVNMSQMPDDATYNYAKIDGKSCPGYSKSKLREVATSFGRNHYDSTTKHFSIEGTGYSEIMLLLLKIASII